jgi:predicted MFS family arabinose efflux permease
MVANQARVYALRPEARGRLNTAYMTCAYLGGSAGSWLGVRVWERAGWGGVCALVAFLAALALARHLPVLLRPSAGTAPRPSGKEAHAARSGEERGPAL